MGASRIAVIAVHGVADQSPGATSRAVVDLLVASAPQGSHYQAIDSESLTMRVEPLSPTGRSAVKGSDVTPLGEERSALKSAMQSRRSDFQRKNWTTPQSSAQAWEEIGEAALKDSDDRGIAMTDFFLGKNLRNGAESESYETTRIGMQRSQDGVPSRVDVFELYWADLSRLSGVLPRIITELFTMVFRLSKLGRDTVDEAREAMRVARAKDSNQKPKWKQIWCSAIWWLAAELQIGLDWLFVNVMALLFLQLALVGSLMLGLGGIGELDPKLLSYLDAAVAGLVTTAGLLLLAYRYREPTFRHLRVPLALILVGSLVLGSLFFSARWAPWLSMLLLLGALTHANETGLRVADDRFPLIRRMGRWMWAIFVAIFLLSAARQFVSSAGATGLESGIWMRAALFAAEVSLYAMKLLWMGVGVLLVCWLIAGCLAAREGGYESRASIATGRLGLGMSLGAFLAISMTIWALLSGALGSAVEGVRYTPCLFPDGRPASDPVTRAPPPAALNACLWTTDAVTQPRLTPDSSSAAASDVSPPIVLPAGEVLEMRYAASTSGFAMVAGLLTGLFGFLLAMFVPSVLAEMKLLVTRARTAPGDKKSERAARKREQEPERDRKRETKRLAALAAIDETRARRLGQWLTAGYRKLDGVTHLVFGLGVLMAGLVALGYANWQPILDYEPAVRNFSQSLLKPLVIGAASIGASLVLFGKVLSKHLPGLRAPLDIALDVDNHFREFPRRGIPRARIFSRYAALLRHVAAGNYDRIVVVAHSQGSVISTELLRYLSSDGKHAPRPGDHPQLEREPLPSIQILTLGCPLRQLYAARFPTLYRWVLTTRDSIVGPRADDIGVVRWINAYCSGDYVGRWLWSSKLVSSRDVLGHPMIDATGPEFGRRDAYSGFDPMPPDPLTFVGERQVEVCLGLGAHTHYFERDQKTVAWLIDALVRDSTGIEPASGEAAAPAPAHREQGQRVGQG